MRRGSTALIVAISLAVAVAYTWPLVTVLSTVRLDQMEKPTMLGQADLSLYAWALRWDVHTLLSRPFALFDANILYPLTNTLAFSDHLLGVALPILPVDLIWGDAIVNYNVSVLLALTLGVTGTALLLQELGGSLVAGITAGILATYIPGRLVAIGAIQQLSTQWMPFALLFLHRVLRTGRWTAGLGFATCFCLTALVSPYHFYFFGVTVALYVAFHVAARRATAPGGGRALAGAAVGIAIVLLPTFFPYLRAREVYGLWRDPAEALLMSARGGDWLGAVIHPVGFLASRYFGGGGPSSLVGWGTIGLSAVALAARARSTSDDRGLVWMFFLLAVATALLSLGPVMRMTFWSPSVPGPYALLVQLVPGFDALRAPMRFQQCTFVALAVVAGLGADVLLRTPRSRIASVLVATLIGVAVVADCWQPRMYLVPAAEAGPVPAVYQWLATAPEGPAVELPLGRPDFDARYMVYSTYHWHPLVNGYSGFLPAQAWIRGAMFQFPDAASLRFLNDLGVRYAIVHPGDLFPARPAFCLQSPTPYLVRRAGDANGCVYEITGAPPPVTVPRDRGVNLSNAVASSSSGDDPRRLMDPTNARRWAQLVDTQVDGWLQIDLMEPRVLSRIALHLGRRFGDYLRIARVEASSDGATWEIVVNTHVLEPPLASFREHPGDVTMEILLPPKSARYLRVVRPAAPQNIPLGVYQTWHEWGAERLELWEREPGALAQ